MPLAVGSGFFAFFGGWWAEHDSAGLEALIFALGRRWDISGAFSLAH